MLPRPLRHFLNECVHGRLTNFSDRSISSVPANHCGFSSNKENSPRLFSGPPRGEDDARILALSADAEFFTLNAVAAGVADVQKVIERGEVNRKKLGKRTTLFIDEIHRFNKAQQDALLHSVEDGILTLVGATTENPSFEVIGPLLSRCVVYVLEPLTAANLFAIVEHALRKDAALSKEKIVLADDLRSIIVELSGGDARLLLNGIEIAVRLTQPDAAGTKIITQARFEDALQRKHFKYDKGGEEHYNIISAFIKCIRGSDPDAAVYWLARMLEGGEDPKFIARRMIVLASEDIGNADPSALPLRRAAPCSRLYRHARSPHHSGAGGDIPRLRSQKQCVDAGNRGGARGCPRRGAGRGSASPSECADQSYERPALRERIQVQP
jgi:putative ATPase